MKMGANRRLANVKTRRETGLDYVVQSLNIQTPFGKREVKEMKPYFPGDEEALKEELNRVEQLMALEPKLTGDVLETFMEAKDISFSVDRALKNTLSEVEVYDIKAMLLLMAKLNKLIKDKVPEEYILEDTTDLLDLLDPRKDRISTFYVYDEFSPLLGELRAKKRQSEIAIRKAQKEKREEIKKEYGIMLTPKFDISIARSNKDLEKAQSIPELEVVDQDYMSITFQLKPTQEVFGFMKEMEEINEKIEEEEEKILRELSIKIGQHKQVLDQNMERMGKLDFALAKAIFAREHSLVKPEIVDEHIVEIEDGRNIQVEDILRSKNKEYCPVSIDLEEGVTCITGANMGGKTISLKLSGQVPILAQYGFFVGASRAKVGLSNYIHILVGDSQSVERGLSTFGSEMEELKDILDRAVERSIILIDEIASGTNPVEGLALTRSLIDYLITKPYISLITTHFETVTQTEGVVNMQVAGLSNANFELLNREIQYAQRRERINIISKYMDYRLVRVEKNGEVPKEALNIVKMLGLNSEIIEGAKKYIK
ncbi:MAG: hypothetical protein MJ146_05725 [Clostridia bacterium]|nr:hypothetical protein [Clostridia bacterium]